MATMQPFEHDVQEPRRDKPYPYWRQHKRAHTTANAHPDRNLTRTQAHALTNHNLLPPKRLHERAPLNLERLHVEEVPIVFMSPVHDRHVFPLSIQTHQQQTATTAFAPRRSAPCTPWPLTPRSPFRDKELPELPVPLEPPPKSPRRCTAPFSPRTPVGPAPGIPLPLTPQSLDHSAMQPHGQLSYSRQAAPMSPKSPRRRAPLAGLTFPPSRMGPAPYEPLPLTPRSPERRPMVPEALHSPRNHHIPRNPARRPRHGAQEIPAPLPSPSATAPETMTTLLSEVLAIMDGIMSQQHRIASEDQILHELTELVVIMQQEAEDLLSLADVVQDYVEEIEAATEVAGIEQWVDELELDRPVGDGVGEAKRSEGGKHKREDSAVSLGAEDDFHAGELRESIYREVPIVRRHTPDNREVKEIQIGGVDARIVQQDVLRFRLQKVPLISQPRARKWRADKPSLTFRDSGLELLSPSSNSGNKTTRAKSPRWI